MAGEMSEKDLNEGGDWYNTKIELLDLAHEAGYDSSNVVHFDQYQGPECLLKKDNLLLGSLWINNNVPFGYIVVAENGRMRESKEIMEAYQINEFLEETWKEWNNGYNPEKLDEDFIEEEKDYYIILSENENSSTFLLCKYETELQNIVEYFQKRLILVNGKYYYQEN